MITDVEPRERTKRISSRVLASAERNEKKPKRRDKIVPPLSIGLSLLVAWMMVGLDMAPLVAAIVVGVVVGAIVINRPVVGVVMIFAGVLIVEQYDFNPRLVPFTMNIPLYDYIFGAAIPISPIDLLIGITLIGSLVEVSRTPRGARPPLGGGRYNPLLLALVLLGVQLVFSFIWGLRRSTCQYYSPVGAQEENCNFAMWVTNWELRSFIYMIIVTLLAYRNIRTLKRASALMWTFAICVAVKALQSIYAYWFGHGHGFGPEEMRALTAHEDAILFAMGILMAVGVLAFGGKRTTLFDRVILAMVPLFIAGFTVANRRAVYVSISLAFICFFISLPNKYRGRIYLVGIPAMVLMLVYLPAFWDKPGTVAARPAQAVRAIVDPSGTDKSSNEFRDIETYDLMYTLRKHLAFGTGFGHRYEQPIEIPKLPNPLQPFIPHNEMLWFWLKTGTVGFVVLWIWMGACYLTSAKVMQTAKDRVTQTIGLMALVIIPMQATAAWVDLQLTFWRNMIWIGVLTGAVAQLYQRMPRDDAPAAGDTDRDPDRIADLEVLSTPTTPEIVRFTPRLVRSNA